MKKFFYSHSIYENHFNENNFELERKEKRIFYMTKSYKEYLRQERKKSFELEIDLMKRKLEKDFNEIDYSHYQYLIQEYYRI